MQTIDGAGHTVLDDKLDETGAAAVAFLAGTDLPAKAYVAGRTTASDQSLLGWFPGRAAPGSDMT
ncbi:hypothetical protein [Actinoplanes sp. NBRC 103695]|uniref:hypothetical protein n=1 Tax=Actinoplanes sp. NBRC 103695 TaxID=3032202 RepID=UPI00255383BD|nr:hypothetical protein [Actinoplanes sp. NBRC 103695]